MTLKATWLWNGSGGGGRLLFGFSETWYSDDAPGLLLPKMMTVAQDRVTMLAAGSTLYGFRIADTAPNSRAYTQRPNSPVKPARGTADPNVPQDAALCVVFGTVGGTRKSFWYHNLPDDFVVDSDFADARMKTFAARNLNLLASLGFKFRYIVQSAPTGRVGSIDAAGNVITLDPITGIVPRSVVQLLKVVGVDGRGKRGKFYVDTVTDETHFKLAAYAGGVVNISGKIRLVQYGFTSLAAVPATGIGSDPTIKPGVRKCGRPFGQLRGRATARR